MPTLKEIAKELGVSIASVSNALTNKGRMRSEVRSAIISKAIELGYEVQNPQILPEKRIAVIAEDVSSQFCSEMLGGISTAGAKHGLACPIYSLGVLRNGLGIEPDIRKLAPLVDDLIKKLPRQSTGIIYVSQYPRDLKEILADYAFPVVYVYCNGGKSHTSVNYDDQQGAYLATQHLIQTGRTRIAMLSGPINSISMNNRLIGYQRALIDSRIHFDPKLVRIGNWGAESGAELTEKLFSSSHQPDAIFSQNDNMALGALRVLHAKGIAVPQDVSVIGFDNLEPAQYSDPPLSSISPRFDEIGQVAMAQMLLRLEGKPAQQDVLVPCELVQRGTSD